MEEEVQKAGVVDLILENGLGKRAEFFLDDYDELGAPARDDENLEDGESLSLEEVVVVQEVVEVLGNPLVILVDLNEALMLDGLPVVVEILADAGPRELPEVDLGEVEVLEAQVFHPQSEVVGILFVFELREQIVQRGSSDLQDQPFPHFFREFLE